MNNPITQTTLIEIDIVGAVGTGKTCLMQVLAEALTAAGFDVCTVGQDAFAPLTPELQKKRIAALNKNVLVGMTEVNTDFVPEPESWMDDVHFGSAHGSGIQYSLWTGDEDPNAAPVDPLSAYNRAMKVLG